MKIPPYFVILAALAVVGFAAFLFPRPEQIGEALEQGGRLDEALMYYDQALRANPTDEPTWVRVGAIAMARGQAETAIDVYRRLVQLDPADIGYRRGLALLYDWNLDIHAAAEQQIKLAELDPRDVSVRQHLVNYYILEKKDYATAIRYAQEITVARPHDAQALVDLAVLYSQTRQLDKALDAYQRALVEDPTDPQISRGIAKVGMWLRQTDALIAQHRARLAEAPDDAATLAQLADLLRGTGRTAEADDIQRRLGGPAPRN